MREPMDSLIAFRLFWPVWDESREKTKSRAANAVDLWALFRNLRALPKRLSPCSDVKSVDTVCFAKRSHWSARSFEGSCLSGSILLSSSCSALTKDCVVESVVKLSDDLGSARNSDATVTSRLERFEKDLSSEATPVSYTHLTLPTIYSV